MRAQSNDVRDRAQLRPHADVYQENEKVTVQLEMPGVAKTNLEVSVEGNKLSILGKRSSTDSGATYHIRERMVGDFAMDLTFDETIDKDQIDAVMENGILKLTLMRKNAETPRKIEIEAE